MTHRRDMAVRSSQRTSLRKRSDYVSNDESTMDEFSSSGDESTNKSRRRNKVRSVKSIRRLFLDSCSYEKSEEHGYTQMRNCKRVRRDTESDFGCENTVSKKSRCVNKNALNARLNREKKKAYLASLEEEIHQLREINQKSECKLKEQDQTIDKMKQDLVHMKSLLANNKYLNNLVSKLSEVTGLPVTSSFIGKIKEEEKPARTRSVPRGANHPIYNNDVSLGGRDMYCSVTPQCESESDFPYLQDDYFLDYDTKELFPFDFSDSVENEKGMGICVHINQNRLSVEFCPICNSMASSV